VPVSLNWPAGLRRGAHAALSLYAARPPIDDREYTRGVQVSDQQLTAINITRDPFHGEWNYAIALH